ncbi:Protein ZBED8 [Trichinella nelsoni]|uniref:Protein ZBED8 n=1 Tax=Trichinella nelsoni TaxID=6336 RepID=A0A0V0RLL5_9BILA|nr:Protein ZBED8 [Trichinella nelsoni]
MPDVLAVHCVIHRQHLVAKHLTERLHCSLGYVIAAINKIRSILLNDRLFSQFCEQNDEEINFLLMHTEVRWLSKGACLSCFYEPFETILEFFQNKDPSLRDSLKKCKSDIAYMADLFSKFNELNLQLQGSELNLIKTRFLISSFISKLVLFKRNLGRREFYQFPSVAALRENGEVHDDDIQIYCDHLDMLQKDMQERFQDILKMKIPKKHLGLRDFLPDTGAKRRPVGTTETDPPGGVLRQKKRNTISARASGGKCLERRFTSPVGTPSQRGELQCQPCPGPRRPALAGQAPIPPQIQLNPPSLKKCKSGKAYMADLFSKFNELILQLQGSELNLIKTRFLISPFISKLALFKRNLGGREFYQFPSVAALREN